MPPVKKSRLRLSLQLTRAEIKKLQQRAAADMRSISGYVAFLVTEELRRRVDPEGPGVSLVRVSDRLMKWGFP
jgi:hypothetical protein